MSDRDVGWDEYGSAKTYSTAAAAIAAASEYDNIRMFYGNNAKRPVWFQSTTSTIMLSWEGMLPRRGVLLLENTTGPNGQCPIKLDITDAKTSDVTIKNLSVGCSGVNTFDQGIQYLNASSSNTGRMNVERCSGMGLYAFVRYDSYGFGDVAYCKAIVCSRAFQQAGAYTTSQWTRFTNCGAVLCQYGFVTSAIVADVRPLLWNCYASICANSNSGNFHATSANNKMQDGSLEYHEGFLHQQVRGGRDYGPAFDAEIVSAKDWVGGGAEYSGLTQDYDIDGRYIKNKQPIGPSIGVDFNGASSSLDNTIVGTVDSSIS